jgi:hypothetical protein
MRRIMARRTKAATVPAAVKAYIKLGRAWGRVAETKQAADGLSEAELAEAGTRFAELQNGKREASK